MADPITAIGAVASVVALIEFSAKIISRIKEYRSKGLELPSAFADIANQLPLLQTILEGLREGIKSQVIDSTDAKALETCLDGCRQQMQKLDELLSKMLPEARDKTLGKMAKSFRSIAKESDVRDIDEKINSYVGRLTFYCAWSSSRLNPRNRQDLISIQQWLAPPDPFMNLRRSLKTRTADTGKWYLQGARYDAWKTGAVPSTWLYGSAGAGKTILNASIIADLQDYCDQDPARSLAFFFFDFNDAEKQVPINMVKSILSQLLDKCPHVPETLQSLYNTCRNGGRRPSQEQLLTVLEQTTKLLPAPYVVLDALDECSEREELLGVLKEMQGWNQATLRVLTTSRKEVDITDAMEEVIPQSHWTSLETHLVDSDIRKYVHKRLTTDKSFKEWQESKDVQEEIETTLGRKAKGMFRWAACQMDSLAQCFTVGKVRRALQDLPKTLDDTYARILRSIEKAGQADDAIVILRWLAYAERPLTAKELLEVTGIVLGPDLHYDKDEVLRGPDSILRICSSLVNSTDSVYADDKQDDASQFRAYYGDQSGVVSGNKTKIYFRLAHFSVKEYLVSTRVPDKRFSLPCKESHDIIASSCLAYLLRFQKDEWQTDCFEDLYPLARYAARFWTQHARTSQFYSQQQRNLTMALLRACPPAYETWHRLFDIGDPENSIVDIRRQIEEPPIPLIAASDQGILHAVRTIVDDRSVDLDAQWEPGNALYRATQGGYEEIVELLLAEDAGPNFRSGRQDFVIIEAAGSGRVHIVKMLLAKGADVKAEGPDGTPLQIACFCGRYEIVQALLAAGADINAGGPQGTALQLASRSGQHELTQALLAAGADINAGGPQGTALQIASDSGHNEIVRALLAAGANINAGGPQGTALQRASEEGCYEVVQALLAAGADVNATGFKGPALFLAADGGERVIVQLLLDAGADVKVRGRLESAWFKDTHGSALVAAMPRSYFRKEQKLEIVQILLDAGAEVSDESGFSRALDKAHEYHFPEVVEVLLTHGAKSSKYPFLNERSSTTASQGGGLDAHAASNDQETQEPDARIGADRVFDLGDLDDQLD
ncbi:hypothetical protein MBLNU230_g2360t1 [Neophaeotheca triangularis]